jgi:hypothetical protein
MKKREVKILDGISLCNRFDKDFIKCGEYINFTLTEFEFSLLYNSILSNEYNEILYSYDIDKLSYNLINLLYMLHSEYLITEYKYPFNKIFDSRFLFNFCERDSPCEIMIETISNHFCDYKFILVETYFN